MKSKSIEYLVAVDADSKAYKVNGYPDCYIVDSKGALRLADCANARVEAVLHAVNLGGDTDTTGCVAGALATLVHGESSIPAPWLCTLAKHNEITDLCEAFAAVS